MFSKTYAVLSLLAVLLALVTTASPASAELTNLAGIAIVQCSLSTEELTLFYNESTGMYMETDSNTTDSNLTDDEQLLVTPANRRLLSQRHSQELFPDDTNSTTHQRLVKACWCTAFFRRDVEYCPAQFDTCSVAGTAGPVTCFNISAMSTFLRGFWPIGIFFFCALLYGFFFTEPGGSARDYMRRSYGCLKCRHKTPDGLLRADVERLVERQPERAVFLYRQAITRQRRDWTILQQRNDRVVARRQRQRQHHLDTATPVLTESARPPANLFGPEPWDRQTLILKTKVFTATDHFEEDPSTQLERPTNPAAGRPHHLPTAQIPSWLPSQFRREHVTMDELEEEMNQGVRCAICLDRLQEGDVVGDIPCQHVFHKVCLKDWLRKKNRCPLCQRDGVATLRFHGMSLPSTGAEIGATVHSAR
jgi:hypothetical protein